MADSKFLRNTKPLTAEMIAVLLILRDSPRALLPLQVEATIGPKGKRVSVADAFDYLEDRSVQFIEREQKPPKTARFTITAEGTRAIPVHMARSIRELEQRIARMQQPHSRDNSVMDPELIAPFEHLLKCLKAGKFGRVKTTEEVQFEAEGGDQEAPPVRRRAKAEAAHEDDDEGLGELQDELGEDAAEGIDEAPAKPARAPRLGSKGNRIPRSPKPAAGRGKNSPTAKRTFLSKTTA